MNTATNVIRGAALGCALLIACGPAIAGFSLIPGQKGMTTSGRGADKIGWARKFRSWCKDHEGNPQCTYVNSLKSPKCVDTTVKNFKDACPGKG
ncbi:MAG: hypothetical protein JNM20_18010 [Rhizobiales bacterium]|nr:hypothetical protein [Hyphomicrobiales bacterium]